MNIKVYIKENCPWCIELEAFLHTNNINYKRFNVSENKELFEEMKNISNQEKAPTVIINDKIFADTDVDQIKSILEEMNLLVQA